MKETIIIPNENILDVPVFSEKVGINEYHSQKIKEFSDRYNLGLTFENVGIEADKYYGSYWDQALVALGHIVISIEINDYNGYIVIYLPTNISEKQYQWFKDHKNFFIQRRKLICFGVVNEDRDIIASYDYANNTLKKLYAYLKEHRSYNESLSLKL